LFSLDFFYNILSSFTMSMSNSNDDGPSRTTGTGSDTMLAFAIESPGDKHGKVLRIPKPTPEGPGFCLIQVLRAGVCNTDLEILQGYMGFTGVLGHEFVGIVRDVNGDDNDLKQKWIGKRVCGDINVGCDLTSCRVCQNADNLNACCPNMSRNHCPSRTVLGILKRNGTMAEFITLPVRNLHVVPDHVSDEVAVFAEPLAAACRIPEQGLIQYDVRKSPDKVAILGDGKLGLMIAEVVGRQYLDHCDGTLSSSPTPQRPILFGKHQHKLDLVKDSGVDTRIVSECIDKEAFNGVAALHAGKYDVVIDATGSPAGLSLAAGLCRPMGTLCLKSTCAAGELFQAAPFVIDELRVVGSRCGPIDKALDLLALTKDDGQHANGTTKKPLGVEKYITETFSLAQAEEAIKCAAEKSTMKVQIICSER
jgi:threonine dehydrogenase-like Zn-dependent dehydrogenase